MEPTRYFGTFRKLIAWQEAHLMTLQIYEVTKKFPSDERFGIISQLRRAASSVSAQIAEGAQMPTHAHRILYYHRAYASASEVDNFLELSKDLHYLPDEIYKKLLGHVNRVCFLVRRLSLSTPSKPSAPSSSYTSFS